MGAPTKCHVARREGRSRGRLLHTWGAVLTRACRAHRPRCAGWDATRRVADSVVAPTNATSPDVRGAAGSGCRAPGGLSFDCAKRKPPRPRKEKRFWRSSVVPFHHLPSTRLNVAIPLSEGTFATPTADSLRVPLPGCRVYVGCAAVGTSLPCVQGRWRGEAATEGSWVMCYNVHKCFVGADFHARPCVGCADGWLPVGIDAETYRRDVPLARRARTRAPSVGCCDVGCAQTLGSLLRELLASGPLQGQRP